MDKIKHEKIILTPLKIVKNQKGDILHGMKKSDDEYNGFGEAYFSRVNKGVIKGWKKHLRMVLNLVVPIGIIEFVIYDEGKDEFYNIVLSNENYCRLTVYPGLWMAFRGLSNENMLLNIASIEHIKDEAVSVDLNEIKYYGW